MIKLCAFSDEYSSSLDKQIEGLKKCNISLMEIRNVNGKNIVDIDEKTACEVYEKLQSNGISVWSIGSPIGKVDIDCNFDEYLEKVEHICKLANIFHTKRIRMFSFFHAYEKSNVVMERLRKMIEVAEKYDVVLCHENEKSIYGDTIERVLEIYENVKGLHFVYDPANYVQCYQDCNEALEKLYPITDYFHIKDVDETEQLVPSGYGIGRIRELINKIDRDTVLTLEPHLTVFEGYSSIDDTEMKHRFTYNTNEEAFLAAVDALKALLIEGGYEEKDGRYERVVRYGIVGCGNIGNTHIANIIKENNVPNAKVVAIADRKQAKLDAIIKKYPQVNFDVYSEGADLIDNAKIDAVIIATPHYQHPELCIRALEKGINVICEKPAGVYTKQVKEMIAVAEKSNSLFTMMFNQRTNCLYRKMREMIRNNDIGTIKRINWIITDWYRSQSYYDSGDWRATWSGEGGGVLFNQCPHQLDLLSWVTGMMPNKIHSFAHFGKWHNIEVEDDVTAYLEYENGATGVFITSTADAPGTNRFEVLGTGGKLVAENNKLTYYKNEMDERVFNEEWKGGFGSPKYEIIEVELDGENLQHTGICRNFTNAILGKEALFVDGREGINGVQLMDAMLLSTWLGQAVQLPIDDELYLNLLNEKIANSSKKESVNEVVLNTENTY